MSSAIALAYPVHCELPYEEYLACRRQHHLQHRILNTLKK
jgi:hypothetical protein